MSLSKKKAIKSQNLSKEFNKMPKQFFNVVFEPLIF